MNDLVQIVTNLRLAKISDLRFKNKQLIEGQPYYLKSQITGEFSGMYLLRSDTSRFDLNEWYEHKMIYVPVSVIDNEIKQITTTQTTIKS